MGIIATSFGLRACVSAGASLFVFLATGFASLPLGAQLVRIDPSTLSTPPFSYLKDSLKRMTAENIDANRYLTFLGSWENNGEANWERSSWWGRFYIDCKDARFRVYHFKHSHVGREWRVVERNYTALYGYEQLCPGISGFAAEARSFNELDREFSREFHNTTSPLNAIY